MLGSVPRRRRRAPGGAASRAWRGFSPASKAAALTTRVALQDCDQRLPRGDCEAPQRAFSPTNTARPPTRHPDVAAPFSSSPCGSNWIRRSRRCSTSSARASSSPSSPRCNICRRPSAPFSSFATCWASRPTRLPRLLETTVASVTSALQRARASIEERVPERLPSSDAARPRRRPRQRALVHGVRRRMGGAATSTPSSSCSRRTRRSRCRPLAQLVPRPRREPARDFLARYRP